MDDAASGDSARSPAWTGIETDIDDHRRAVVDNDRLGDRCRNREAGPTTPAPDKRLAPAKAIESKAIEVSGAESVEVLRAETVEPKPARIRAPIEPMRHEMGSVTHSKRWMSE